MTTINIDIKQSGALLTGQPQTIIQAGLDRLITKITHFLDAEVKKRTPQGVFGAQGGLLGSIQTPPIQGKGTPLVRGEVVSAQKYAEVIEKGRSPGKGISKDADLSRWIEVKFGVDAKTAKRLEYVVRRKIIQKGFKGAHMFEKAVTENEGTLDTMAQAEGFKIAVELD